MFDFTNIDLSKEFGVTTAFYPLIDSTNLEAKRQIRNGLMENKLFWAKEQSAGRGRMDRKFLSNQGEGLYFSLAIHLPGMDENVVRLTAKTGVAVVRGIQECVNVSLSLKWVNDIILNGKKLAGILVETLPDVSGQGYFAVIGVGVNIGHQEFPEELAQIATSLKLPEKEILPVMKAILDNMMREYDCLEDCSYLEDYRQFSCVLGENITFGQFDRMEKGKALSIDDTGALLVEKEDGTIVRLSTGEISVRLQ